MFSAPTLVLSDMNWMFALLCTHTKASCWDISFFCFFLNIYCLWHKLCSDSFFCITHIQSWMMAEVVSLSGSTEAVFTSQLTFLTQIQIWHLGKHRHKCQRYTVYTRWGHHPWTHPPPAQTLTKAPLMLPSSKLTGCRWKENTKELTSAPPSCLPTHLRTHTHSHFYLCGYNTLPSSLP